MIEYPSPTADDLLVIAEQVWTSYLDPEGVNPLIQMPPGETPKEVSAAVSVTGAWRGHVVISFSAAASRHAAAGLLGIGYDDVSTADITDAVGELVQPLLEVAVGGVRHRRPPRVVAVSVVRAVRSLSSAAEVWLFTVPGLTPRSAAVSSTDSPQ